MSLEAHYCEEKTKMPPINEQYKIVKKWYGWIIVKSLYDDAPVITYCPFCAAKLP